MRANRFVGFYFIIKLRFYKLLIFPCLESYKLRTLHFIQVQMKEGRGMKADYEEIAKSYDESHLITCKYTKERINKIVSDIIELAGLKAGQTLLDLGCGTGRFAIPFAYNFGLKVTGADKSPAMLSRAQEKDFERLCKWVEYDSEGSPPYKDYFDSIFVCHLLHHLSRPLRAINNCFTMLKPGGVLIIRYGAWSQIKNDTVHTFFPEAKEVDKNRTPEIEDVEKWLKKAGFTGVVSKVSSQQTHGSFNSLLRALSLKETSVLTLISEESFLTGLTRLRRHIELNPDDKRLLYDQITVTVARKHGFSRQTHAHGSK
ncbi:MAG: class I SAM-dependent methyltransferase [Candidatus Nanoarchaeia archaeon]